MPRYGNTWITQKVLSIHNTRAKISMPEIKARVRAEAGEREEEREKASKRSMTQIMDISISRMYEL